MDVKARFSDRVADYVRARPGYPEAVYAGLVERGVLKGGERIADIGAGTGLSAELFLKHGHRVTGIEPNEAMREAGAAQLSRYADAYTAQPGGAEATGLADRSVDLIVAAQAFHWFEPLGTRREFLRILKPRGQVVLLWNDRRTDSTPFLRDYEALLQKHGTDYREVNHRNIDAAKLAAFFSPSSYTEFVCENVQRFDYAGLEARLLSSSYTPPEGDARRQPMLAELRELYRRHAENDEVAMVYDTRVFFGQLS